MITTKKFSAFITVLLLTALIPASLSALPGITSNREIPSGQYIFYRDYTFTEETYIGFLSYDNETIALRTFTVATQLTSSGDVSRHITQDVTTYLRLDPAVDFISIIGETTPTSLTDAEIDSINYAHDMLYELTSRRKRLNGLQFSPELVLTQEYVQFGGNVHLTWQNSMPLFNLRTITSEDGNIVFEAVTMGILQSSDDTAFSDFSGFDDAPSLVAAKKIPTADSILDSQWEDLYPYCRSLTTADGAALHTYAILTYDNGAQEYISELSHQLLQSVGSSYTYLPNATLLITADGIYSKVLSAVETDEKWNCSITKIKPLDETDFVYQELVCYSGFYRKHSAYIEDLINRFEKNMESAER